MGWTETQSWVVQCACIYKRRKHKGQRFKLTTKRETTKTKYLTMQDGPCSEWHQLGSNVSQLFQVTSHVVGIFALHFLSPLQLFSLNQFSQFLTCTRILCRDYTAKMVLRGTVFTPPVGCSRPSSAVNGPTAKNSWTKSVWGFFFTKIHKQRVSPFFHVALHESSFVDFLWIILSSTRNRTIGTNWKNRWMVPVLILPVRHWLELSFSRLLVQMM